MDFKLVGQPTATSIPSTSGMVWHKNFYYTIGDDSPYLYKLDREFGIISRTEIYGGKDSLSGNRIPKSAKPDFEAMELVKNRELIIFGSGSKSPQRDQFLKIPLKDPLTVECYSLSNFYTYLKELPIMRDSELNIEAVAYHRDTLYIFNRRKNIIFTVPYKDFIHYLESAADFPKVDAKAFELPNINGVEAGFSGATVVGKQKILVITASVEDTDNAYDDGQILGSYLGVLPLADIIGKNDIRWQLLETATPLKVESVCVADHKTAEGLEVTLSTDSDGGPSLFLKGSLNW